MREFLILLLISTASYFFLYFYPNEKASAPLSKNKISKSKDFCESLKKEDIPFKAFLSEVFSDEMPELDVYSNLDKINCYTDYSLKKYGYKYTLNLLNKLLDLANEKDTKPIIIKVQKIIDEKNLEELYSAVYLFYNKYKRYPVDLNQLIEMGLMEFIPVEPYGAQYYIDTFGQIKRTNKRDSF